MIFGVKNLLTGVVISTLFSVFPAAASESRDKCLASAVHNAQAETTVEALRATCVEDIQLTEREEAEKAITSNEFALSPFKQNYVLVYSQVAEANQAPYEGVYGLEEPIDDAESKFQLSIKVPLTYSPLFTDDGAIYAAFTLKAFWQVYNNDISAPFRETNYQPEIFYRTTLPFANEDRNWKLDVGVEHQSNGRSQELSRSWNRAFFRLAYIEEDWGVVLRPWYRFKEDEKEDDGDPATPPSPAGDDNPDIEDYLGHYELGGAYKFNSDLELTGMSRYNWSTGYGSIELGLSFPLYGKLKGYVQYFNGYGESLIDYNYSQERLGVGIMLTDWY